MLLLLAILVAGIISSSSQAARLDCTKHSTCGKCIASSPLCSWCKQENYTIDGTQEYPRCDTVQNHLIRGCKDVSNPVSSGTATVEEELTDQVKVTPRNYTLRLRPGKPHTVTIKVRTPENYPVDLYYLLDMSYSLRTHLVQLKSLGNVIANEMKNITKNFRLGFGAFVDKPLAPYIKTLPGVLLEPEDGAIPTFGFKNVFPLNTDTSKFNDVVGKQKISANVDMPEGGLDALMQVAVCDTEIGWAKKTEARRLVIFTTDASFHIAGDGLLGGVVTPNDGSCHTRNGMYMSSTKLDYPSLGFLRDKLLESEIIPVFAVFKNVVPLYGEVVDYLGEESGAVVEEMAKDSRSIVRVIKESYLKIAETQTVFDDAPDGIKVEYTAVCPDGVYPNTKTCKNVKIGEEVSFNVSITAESCDPDIVKHKSFFIRTSFEDVAVKLSLICECDCETSDSVEYDSPACSGHGDKKCGMCVCNPGWKGRNCSCNETLAKNQDMCRRDGSEQVCSGRGQCVCGECICDKSDIEGQVIYGHNCECSNVDCPRDNDGNVCGGPLRGTCDCGTCDCIGNWTGPDCTCPKSNDACINDGLVCNGKGTCDCGECKCNVTTGYTRGKYCDICPGCEGVCETHRECVQCVVFQKGELTADECKRQCGDLIIIEADYIDDANGKRCVFVDDDDCNFYFAYRQDEDGNAVLTVQKEKVCPRETEFLAVILSVVAGIVLIGLILLLIWKLIATIQDRREFAKWQKEKNNAKWDTGENPIFSPATTQYQNPTFQRS